MNFLGKQTHSGYTIGTSGLTTLVDIGVDTDWKDPHNAKVRKDYPH